MRKTLYVCCLLLFKLQAVPQNITVAGTGVTGIWTAYTICRDLEQANNKETTITIIGKWDWFSAFEQAAKQKTAVFSHEASGFGPMGIQPHSGLLWNTDNEVIGLIKKGIGRKEAFFYSSSDLEEEGKEFLELYAGWHSRHLDPNDPASSFQRQGVLITINRYARGLWGQFYEEQHLEKDNRFSLCLEGAWRLYDDPEHFTNGLKSLEILDFFAYSATPFPSPGEIAAKIPYYKRSILADGKKGIFFSDDGYVNSNEVRKFLWSYLKNQSRVIMRLNSEVAAISLDEQGNCCGLILDTGEIVPSDIAILAMGIGNKSVLARKGIQLPMWNIWGAAVLAMLKEKSVEAPRGGVSFHTERCFTAVPHGKSVIVAGMTMVIPAEEIPTADLYKDKLMRSLAKIFGQQVDDTTLKFRIAPRPGIADDLPIIDLETKLRGLIVLNPTSHLGNTQSIGLGKLTSLHILQKPIPFNLHEYRLDRFEPDIQKVREDRQNGVFLLFDRF